jgi:DNA replication protein DnaC
VTPLGVTIAQLRGHLAYLKLTDAAAALPAVLDTAKTEKLSATATLERLLRIEVQATEARRVAGRLRFANLPTAATLDDFDYDAQPGVDPALISNLASNRYLDTATNILLIGPPGVGKTMLAVGLARRAAEPVTARTSPTPPTSRPAATGRRSRAGGRPRCGSTPARRA